LVKLAGRLKPEETARVCGKAAQHVLDRMDKTHLSHHLNVLAEALAKLAERLGPEEAAKAAQRILDRMDKAAQRFLDQYVLPILAPVLVKLAERCSDQQLVELLKHPHCVGLARDKVQAALNKRKK
jgi:hypothetical protein